MAMHEPGPHASRSVSGVSTAANPFVIADAALHEWEAWNSMVASHLQKQHNPTMHALLMQQARSSSPPQQQSHMAQGDSGPEPDAILPHWLNPTLSSIVKNHRMHPCSTPRSRAELYMAAVSPHRHAALAADATSTATAASGSSLSRWIGPGAAETAEESKELNGTSSSVALLTPGASIHDASILFQEVPSLLLARKDGPSSVKLATQSVKSAAGIPSGAEVKLRRLRQSREERQRSGSRPGNRGEIAGTTGNSTAPLTLQDIADGTAGDEAHDVEVETQSVAGQFEHKSDDKLGVVTTRSSQADDAVHLTDVSSSDDDDASRPIPAASPSSDDVDPASSPEEDERAAACITGDAIVASAVTKKKAAVDQLPYRKKKELKEKMQLYRASHKIRLGGTVAPLTAPVGLARQISDEAYAEEEERHAFGVASPSLTNLPTSQTSVEPYTVSTDHNSQHSQADAEGSYDSGNMHRAHRSYQSGRKSQHDSPTKASTNRDHDEAVVADELNTMGDVVVGALADDLDVYFDGARVEVIATQRPEQGIAEDDDLEAAVMEVLKRRQECHDNNSAVESACNRGAQSIHTEMPPTHVDGRECANEADGTGGFSSSESPCGGETNVVENGTQNSSGKDEAGSGTSSPKDVAAHDNQSATSLATRVIRSTGTSSELEDEVTTDDVDEKTKHLSADDEGNHAEILQQSSSSSLSAENVEIGSAIHCEEEQNGDVVSQNADFHDSSAPLCEVPLPTEVTNRSHHEYPGSISAVHQDEAVDGQDVVQLETASQQAHHDQNANLSPGDNDTTLVVETEMAAAIAGRCPPTDGCPPSSIPAEIESTAMDASLEMAARREQLHESYEMRIRELECALDSETSHSGLLIATISQLEEKLRSIEALRSEETAAIASERQLLHEAQDMLWREVDCQVRCADMVASESHARYDILGNILVDFAELQAVAAVARVEIEKEAAARRLQLEAQHWEQKVLQLETATVTSQAQYQERLRSLQQTIDQSRLEAEEHHSRSSLEAAMLQSMSDAVYNVRLEAVTLWHDADIQCRATANAQDRCCLLSEHEHEKLALIEEHRHATSAAESEHRLRLRRLQFVAVEILSPLRGMAAALSAKMLLHRHYTMWQNVTQVKMQKRYEQTLYVKHQRELVQLRDSLSTDLSAAEEALESLTARHQYQTMELEAACDTVVQLREDLVAAGNAALMQQKVVDAAAEQRQTLVSKIDALQTELEATERLLIARDDAYDVLRVHAFETVGHQRRLSQELESAHRLIMRLSLQRASLVALVGRTVHITAFRDWFERWVHRVALPAVVRSHSLQRLNDDARCELRLWKEHVLAANSPPGIRRAPPQSKSSARSRSSASAAQMETIPLVDDKGDDALLDHHLQSLLSEDDKCVALKYMLSRERSEHSLTRSMLQKHRDLLVETNDAAEQMLTEMDVLSRQNYELMSLSERNGVRVPKVLSAREVSRLVERVRGNAALELWSHPGLPEDLLKEDQPPGAVSQSTRSVSHIDAADVVDALSPPQQTYRKLQDDDGYIVD